MPRTGRSVTASVMGGFAFCLAAVSVLVAVATKAAFDQEQERAQSALSATGQSLLEELGSIFESATPLISDLAADPGLAQLEPGACARVLSPFDSVTSAARLVVLDGAGRLVCSLPDGTAAVPVERYEDALRGDVVESAEPFLDRASGEPAVTVAAPVSGRNGPTGAVVGVIFTDQPSLALPPAVDPATVVVAVADGGLVMATTEAAPYEAGTSVDWDTPPGGGPDGVERIWRTVSSPDTGWRVHAGLDVDRAFAGARSQRRYLLGVGVAILGLVVLLAVTLQRRLARPIRRLGAAIASSRAGDETARAPIAGPTEVIEVAVAFNELVEDHHVLAEQLRRSAREDALTGLLNRRGANEELTRLLADPSAAPLAVLFIDLDRFKLVNDSHGHSVGDQLLVDLASHLRSMVPDHWVVTRFGGDEFVIICPRTLDPEPQAEALGALLRSTFHVGEHDLTVGGSTGIALARPGDDPDDLIREADTAMYRAKAQGGGGYATFDEEMRRWTMTRLTTERDLRGAAERDELRLHFQPVVDLTTGRVVAAEGLVRWQHPQLGLVAPASFIPVAEETGLILEIGRWVMNAAAAEAAAWRRAGHPLRVAVNVAAAQLLRADLRTLVAEALAAHGTLPGDITIEVTESALLADVEATVAELRAVRRLGVGVSLDDFGTGYSSLSYLQLLPADELKVDRSFVDPIADDPVSASIVAAVIDLAHAVGLRVVAEGVEREDQLTRLESLGCDRAQGYYLGRPVPAEEMPLGVLGPRADTVRT